MLWVIKEEKHINKKSTVHKLKMKRNEKMAKTKNRIKKMIFQTQNRSYLPLSEEHKYILARREPLSRGSKQNEDISRTTGRALRP